MGYVHLGASDVGAGTVLAQFALRVHAGACAACRRTCMQHAMHARSHVHATHRIGVGDARGAAHRLVGLDASAGCKGSRMEDRLVS